MAAWGTLVHYGPPDGGGSTRLGRPSRAPKRESPTRPQGSYSSKFWYIANTSLAVSARSNTISSSIEPLYGKRR